MWFFVVVTSIFPDTSALAGIQNGSLGIMIGLLLLFGSAITGFAYVISLFFTSPSMAQVATIFIVFIQGLILGILGTVLRILPTTNWIFLNFLRYLFLLVPPFALSDGLNNLILLPLLSFRELGGVSTYHPLDMEIAGLPLVFLAWESVVFLAGVIVHEYVTTIPSFQALYSSSVSLPADDDSVKDEDVRVEEQHVTSGSLDQSSAILVRGIKKAYGEGKYAVRGVSLGIPHGECFGLLG